MATKREQMKIDFANKIITLMEENGGDAGSNQQKEILAMEVADLYQQYLKEVDVGHTRRGG